MTKFQKQVEVQGTKKLDSVKGVQALELNEMRETQGGVIPFTWIPAIAVIGGVAALGFYNGYKSVK